MSGVTRHTTVWLVRHPQTDWNKARRYQSRSDRPLTPLGAEAGPVIAARLRRVPFTAIVSSGLTRTNTVAALVAAQRPAAVGWTADERWRETDHGDWEGLTYEEVMARFADQARSRWGDPWSSRAHGGDSLADVWVRVAAAWQALIAAHDGGHILIVTHATPIQILLCALLGMPLERYWQFRSDLGGVTGLDLYPSGAIMRVINEVPRYTAEEY